MRSIEESTALIDGIVGRCVRDAEFARNVLRSPEEALAEYELTQAEMDDFRALKAGYAEQALEGWAFLRSALGSKDV